MQENTPHMTLGRTPQCFVVALEPALHGGRLGEQHTPKSAFLERGRNQRQMAPRHGKVDLLRSAPTSAHTWERLGEETEVLPGKAPREPCS